MQIPNEIWGALILFAVTIIGTAGKLADFIATRKINKAKKADEDALKDREAERQKESEAQRQKNMQLEIELEKVRSDAAENKAINENLTNLTAAFLKSVETYAKEQFANREALSNNTQTVGDLAQSVDRVGTILSENTSVTRATGAKAESVVAAIEHLEQIMNSGVREIKLLLAPPPPLPPQNIVNVNTSTPVEKPADAGSEAA